jgi:hypothetical protein
MRVAGGVLGIIGGVLGLFLAAFLLVVGGVSKVAANAAANDATVNSNLTAAQRADLDQGIKAASDLGNIAGGLGLVLVILCLLGVGGGIFGFFNPPVGALMMVISGIGGFFIANIFWGLSGILLLLGAVLAFIGTFQKPNPQLQPAVAPQSYYPPAAPNYPQQGYYPQPQAYPQQAYQPQQPYTQQGFPQPQQQGQPQQPVYPQPTGQGYTPQAGQQNYYPRPATAPDGQHTVPPQDNTKLN